ncbi:helix-turn-helix domain-containing protein [Paenibacillus sp. Leaf72]|uniref:helix-turn-helix domain-containing protein n=1 Tax=Paenibacillus sp. Leaf72 TaxID=1736234 RepID=UPI00138F05F8|nr:helix-turn-helix transcriptional regulator [Paenibacillus sp. Leaf72]
MFSQYYLSRKFKQCTGFGFSEYVQLVRIREAQRLLRETDLKIIEVAACVGIDPVANFHKLFKSTNGCSPLQYRKRQRRG